MNNGPDEYDGAVPCSHVLPSQPGNRGERQHAGGRCVRQSREPRPGEGKPIGSGGVLVARRTGNRRRRPRKADATATILPIQSNSHYYKNIDLSRLTPVRDKRGCPFVPGLATGTKGYLLGQKVLPAPRGWRTLLSRLVLPTGTKCPFFFPVFLFSILFLFQLYFCISIKFMY